MRGARLPSRFSSGANNSGGSTTCESAEIHSLLMDARVPCGCRPRPILATSFRLRSAMRRQQIALVLVAVWALVSLARLTRLVESPEPPPGQSLVPLLPFLRETIPPDAGYLLVLPTAFGADTGDGPRIRYELYPRTY